MISQRTLLLAAMAVSLGMSGAARAEGLGPGAWYLGAGGMPVFQSEADANVNSTTDVIKYNTGWGVSGSGGYAWDNGLRAEAEVAYRRAGVDSVKGTGSAATSGGSLSNVSVMGNVLYDYKTGTRFTPYVGAGIGLSVVGAHDIRTIVGSTADDDRSTFAYQFIGGVSTELTRNWAVTADYRYFRTLDEKFETNLSDHATIDNASHNVMIGVRYTFNAPEPAPALQVVDSTPAPVPAAQPPARPVVAPVPQSYMVFFDFDKSVLTPEAKRIIATAAQDFKQGKFVRVVVTGHTDTMGTVQYNVKLSERRAAAVRKEFMQLGLPSSAITTIGAGKSGLLVPTNDQVREAQNRRAEIVFNK